MRVNDTHGFFLFIFYELGLEHSQINFLSLYEDFSIAIKRQAKADKHKFSIAQPIFIDLHKN
jgi:hypothetical protein